MVSMHGVAAAALCGSEMRMVIIDFDFRHSDLDSTVGRVDLAWRARGWSYPPDALGVCVTVCAGETAALIKVVFGWLQGND